MKIAATVSNVGDAANVGGEVNRCTYIIDVPDDAVPVRVKRAFRSNFGPEKHVSWESVSLSFVDEESTGVMPSIARNEHSMVRLVRTLASLQEPAPATDWHKAVISLIRQAKELPGV